MWMIIDGYYGGGNDNAHTLTSVTSIPAWNSHTPIWYGTLPGAGGRFECCKTKTLSTYTFSKLPILKILKVYVVSNEKAGNSAITVLPEAYASARIKVFARSPIVNMKYTINILTYYKFTFI
jgi:hypothetical protein